VFDVAELRLERDQGRVEGAPGEAPHQHRGLLLDPDRGEAREGLAERGVARGSR
jgi:hypothetical protein